HLEATWPKGTKINSFFITDDGKAYVDLSPEQGMMENMDTQSELLAIYSLVNSLTLNIPKIEMVKILIQGQDALTLAGHIDLEYFYKTNMLMVK
ncbi:MAG: GerMN domain-containing protein, partial [Proteobacteria bacterium]|nr:GerMN domain-containing protein [Pseudomonadota bacterium]